MFASFWGNVQSAVHVSYCNFRLEQEFVATQHFLSTCRPVIAAGRIMYTIFGGPDYVDMVLATVTSGASLLTDYVISGPRMRPGVSMASRGRRALIGGSDNI